MSTRQWFVDRLRWLQARLAAGEAERQYAAESVYIGLVVRSVASSLLGRHVPISSCSRTARSLNSTESDTEIEEQGTKPSSPLLQHHVRRLQVAVDHTITMNGFQGFTELVDDLGAHRGRQRPPAADVVLERGAREKRHPESVEAVVLSLSVDLNDARSIQTSQQSGLFQGVGGSGVRKVRVQDLQSDYTVESLLHRSIHDAEAAPGDFVDDAQSSPLRAGLQSRRGVPLPGCLGEKITAPEVLEADDGLTGHGPEVGSALVRRNSGALRLPSLIVLIPLRAHRVTRSSCHPSRGSIPVSLSTAPNVPASRQGNEPTFRGCFSRRSWYVAVRSAPYDPPACPEYCGWDSLRCPDSTPAPDR